MLKKKGGDELMMEKMVMHNWPCRKEVVNKLILHWHLYSDTNTVNMEHSTNLNIRENSEQLCQQQRSGHEILLTFWVHETWRNVYGIYFTVKFCYVIVIIFRKIF